MASSLPPVRGSAFTFHTALVSQADTDIFKTSPTLAAGDIKVSKDGGNFANITTLPTQIETTGVLPVVLSAAEMTADVVTVLFHDAAGDEWQDQVVTIYTAAQTLDTTDGVADNIYARLGAPAGASVSADIAAVMAGEGSLDTLEMLRIMYAVLAGKSAGGGTGTITFRNVADDANRVSATVDANGNRSAVTVDGA